MARDGVAVETALVALVGRIVAGDAINISAEAARLGTSRKRIYHYVRRYRAEGVRPAINDLWQLDGYETVLLTGKGRNRRTRKAWVIDIIDDHSRLLLASHAAASESAEAVWAAFRAAAATAGGLPRQLLTDNARAMNGSRRGFTAPLEAAVTVLGVEPISTSVGKPQANGKVERVHATNQLWLAARQTPPDLAGLQTQLDGGRDYYNHHRRHQALTGRTPKQAWEQALAEHRVSGPNGTVPPPLHLTNPPVSARGVVRVDNLDIGIGRSHIGATVTVFRTGTHVAVFINGRYDHERELDHSKRYQAQISGS